MACSEGFPALVSCHLLVVISLLRGVLSQECTPSTEGHFSCQPWAERHQCWVNPWYMSRTCPWACNVTAACHPELGDESSDCQVWAHQGRCEDSTQDAGSKCPYTCAKRAAAPLCPPPVIPHMAAIALGQRDTYRCFDVVKMNCPLAIKFPLTYYDKAPKERGQACFCDGHWIWDVMDPETECSYRRASQATRPHEGPGATVTLTVLMTSSRALSAISCHVTCYQTPGCRYFALRGDTCYQLTDESGPDVITLPRKDVWDRRQM